MTEAQLTISVTDTAQSHIRKQLQHTQAKFLRLGVKESGCNGYMYTLDFLEQQETDDICVNVANGVDICVQPTDQHLVHGTEIDMITQGLNSALVFKNSQATSYCGCGESFAVPDDAADATELNSAQNLDPDGLAQEV